MEINNMMMNMMTSNIGSNIMLFDIGEIPYDPDYIKRHRDDFDIYGNYIGYVDDDWDD